MIKDFFFQILTRIVLHLQENNKKYFANSVTTYYVAFPVMGCSPSLSNNDLLF